ncbi:MAG: molybdenum cofactor guanylyltransferase [Saprospiraceae bacterium]|nr:molybdenum cofactor guanylyltransferase [Saprospiraceae bacterium]
MIGLDDIDFFILAGGQSRRMGKDKAMLKLNGKSFLQMLADNMGALSNSVRIIGGFREDALKGFDFIPDFVSNQGPMGGIYTALYHCLSPYALVVACDTPCITTESIQYLIRHSHEQDINVTFDGRNIHPLFGIYSKRLLPLLEKNIQNAQLRMREFIYSVDFRIVDVTPLMEKHPFLLFNVNTEEDYQKLISECSHQK